MGNWLKGEIVEGKGALALLALRLAAGPAFMLHGWPKFQHATTWMGEGLPPALQFLVAFGELFGGAAILLGFLTHLAAAGLTIIMLGAINLHVSKGDPFVGMGSSWELAGAYLAIMIALALRGPGRFSVDSLFRKK